ncbi:TetR family transcriptional regulator [Streptomyces qinzhouensis]|uniref:TetR family transcriptional regulator n=1 Tax=Streptomyces qinzhouensis TaxID=2599401 RepID=A0A5B8JHV2_9ACTN|nr:TetR family transcriptional regulator [Streptomyces qinzhouensis]QDY81096.1 TetR family transcriptional regulator [Streptomyces qinzhouensis]
MREALAEAAFELFLERGFERTTVDDIVARAGVGRRSFFRYFPSKEDAVFPDHEGCLVEMTAYLEANAGSPDPVGTVCDAAGIVMRMYAAKPDFSVQRYRLTREVPGLRTYELSVVRRYERTLANHLRDHGPETADGSLRAEVIASAVVAAHNNALRSWLRAGGEGNAEAAADHALSLVRDVWGTAGGAGAAAVGVLPGRLPEGDGEVVIMVARKGTPVWRVVRGIESALGASPVAGGA